MSVISYKPVKAYEVQTRSGPLSLTQGSTWNGLTELVDQQGRKLIVLLPGGLASEVAAAFTALGVSGEVPKMTIVTGSAELLLELGVLKGKAETVGCATLSAKVQRFVQDLRSVCHLHALDIGPSGWDVLQVWPLQPGDTPLGNDGSIVDRTG